MLHYTIEVYVRDRRLKTGERLLKKVDYRDTSGTAMQDELLDLRTNYYPAPKYRLELHDTYVTRKNLLNGQEFEERYDTPYFCSPSSESYWSM